METKKDGEMETVASLPSLISNGPFFNVLSRLSLEDLHRSTALSREWRDTINFPDTRKNLPQTLQGFFYTGYESRRLHGDRGDNGGRDGSYRRLLSMEPLTAKITPDDTYGLHFLDLLPKSMPVPACVDTSFSFLPSPPSGGSTNLMCSCNGLLLLGCRKNHSERYGSLGYIVCNPATKQWVTVPSFGWPRTTDYDAEKFESTFLFFDPAGLPPSCFLLIQFWHGEDGALEGVHVYSSQAREWSDRSSEWVQFAKGGRWGREHGVKIESRCGSSFVNGMLHFLVQRKRKQGVLIVAVGGEGSICSKPIRRRVPKYAKPDFIGQSRGVLHCVSAPNKDLTSEDRGGSSSRAPTTVDPSSFTFQLIEARRKELGLKDYDDYYIISPFQEPLPKYSRKPRIIVHIDAFTENRSFDILISDLHEEKENEIDVYQMDRMVDYEVVAIHPDGELLYLINRANGELMQYDMGRHSCPRDEKVLRLCTLGHCNGPVIPYVPCFSRSSALEIKGDSENPV